VLVVKTPEWTDDFGIKHPPELIPAKGFKANLREDTGEVLGIVSDEYEVVDNRDAFHFLDALIGSDLYFETAAACGAAVACGCWGGAQNASSSAATDRPPTSTSPTATRPSSHTPQPITIIGQMVVTT
jgi:hypothetical protein